jgi:hypothetical protein
MGTTQAGASLPFAVVILIRLAIGYDDDRNAESQRTNGKQ